MTRKCAICGNTYKAVGVFLRCPLCRALSESKRTVHCVPVAQIPDYVEQRGKTPKFKHFCPEWDGLEIDETWPEFEACLCFKPKVEVHLLPARPKREPLKTRYSAVLEVEFEADNFDQAQKFASHIADGVATEATLKSMSGHVSPHTVRLAEEPE